MDLEEWELLPEEGFLEEIYDDGGKKIYSRKYPSESRSVFQMNYFLCPPNHHHQQILPDAFSPQIREFKIVTSQDSADDETTSQDSVSQVFFKKMKEADHQFADIKVESPRSSSCNRGILQQIEGSGQLQFEEKIVDFKKEEDDHDDKEDDDEDDDEDEEGGPINLWKRSLTGIGAICSLGFAAATVCIIVFSSGGREGKNLLKNQKLTFQIYTNDKRIKQMAHHANKLSEAMNGLSGIPITRAHITVGGYYDAPL